MEEYPISNEICIRIVFTQGRCLQWLSNFSV